MGSAPPPFCDFPLRDMPREELLPYLSPRSIADADARIQTPQDEDGEWLMPLYIGGVLYWIIHWFGATDDRTYVEYKATDSFKSILIGDSE